MAEPSTLPDVLLALRRAFASGTPPTPTTSEDATSATDANEDLSKATHLQFSSPSHTSYPLSAPTRFISSDKPVDLRSIFFAWKNKDVPITEYIASTQKLNEDLATEKGGAGGQVQNLIFVEKLDLIAWLEGASDESEYITPLEAEAAAAQAADSALITSGAAGGIATVPSGTAGKGALGRTLDPRLQEIYNGERRMGDRNSVLRGIKPTDFSHVRKSAEVFLSKSRHARAAAASTTNGPATTNTSTLPIVPSPASKKSNRRPDPIILLSPSASSLLRLSNIKPFLEAGAYQPPDSSSSASSILHISRLLPQVDSQRPLRFILVDTPEQFKPDYWNRVVAVFTTGQTWQFKGYKWQQPMDLFRNVLGIYIGWRGEDVPANVKGWGRGVACLGVDKWMGPTGNRWRDREVVEGFWGRVQEHMVAKGWGKDGIGR
ncbi:accessory factor associated with RNA polymerase II [Agyrium rufum]|nr:accessory factor associated with RNA polymerase II [Agyrium rufum]